MDKKLFAELGFLQKTLDAIPAILLIADSDVHIQYLNSTAANKLGLSLDDVYMKRGGEVLHCIHAYETPDGCGRSDDCRECIIRNSVNKTIKDGKVYREKTRMQVIKNDKETDIFLLVTSSPLEYKDKTYVLLALEDISELIQLRSLLPMCAWCKKIRNDKDYWESIEEYFESHVDVEFTHGLCEECSEKLCKGLPEK